MEIEDRASVYLPETVLKEIYEEVFDTHEEFHSDGKIATEIFKDNLSDNQKCMDSYSNFYSKPIKDKKWFNEKDYWYWLVCWLMEENSDNQREEVL